MRIFRRPKNRTGWHISREYDVCVAIVLFAERDDTEKQLALREGHTNWREGSQTGRASQTARGEATILLVY